MVDYGAGNLRSVEKALLRSELDVRVTGDPAVVRGADGVVLPGVGAFGACVEGVRRPGFDRAVRDFLGTGRPFLGICIGMQILVETSEEDPEVPGLGIIQGRSPRFRTDLKVPHMGWNRVRLNGGDSALFRGIPDESYFYFVHSYYVEPEGKDASTVIGTCEYAVRFAAALERKNLFATQFHPEKSQKWGLKLLENFASL